MIINLPNGKSIEVPLEVYLRMTDEDYEYLMSINSGSDIHNPFEASVLVYGEVADEELDEELLEDMEIIDLEDLDKLQDLDAEPDE